jgi:hypothetical protein
MALDPTQVTPPASTEGQGQEPEGTSPPVTKTPEDVDAEWRHRVSQKDKAHAAAEQALREENDALKRQLNALAPRDSGGQSNGQQPQGETERERALREQLAAAKREAEEEKNARALDARKAKYPALAKQPGITDAVFIHGDEATLARLNALADDEANGVTIAPTSPRKPASQGQPKGLNEMSKAELEAELKRSVERGDHIRQP